MDNGLFERMLMNRREGELAEVLRFNEKSGHFGLTLTARDARELMACRDESLQKYRRVEFGKGILEALIFEFCDSQYLNEANYVETLEKLQDTFYLLKNETEERMTDGEILHFMKEQFESVCAGDADHLADTCLERLARNVRQGSRSHEVSDGRGIYGEVDEEMRWDPDLYYQVLKESTWE